MQMSTSRVICAPHRCTLRRLVMSLERRSVQWRLSGHYCHARSHLPQNQVTGARPPHCPARKSCQCGASTVLGINVGSKFKQKSATSGRPATNAACIRVTYKPPPTSILSLLATKSCLVSQLRPRIAARDSGVALVGDEYLARSLTDRPFSLTPSNIQVHAAKWGLVGSNRNSTRS